MGFEPTPSAVQRQERLSEVVHHGSHTSMSWGCRDRRTTVALPVLACTGVVTGVEKAAPGFDNAG
jgi:hypothetical protein